MCNYARKRRIWRENGKYAPNEKLYGHFAIAERLPTSVALVLKLSSSFDPFRKTLFVDILADWLDKILTVTGDRDEGDDAFEYVKQQSP